eukprot:218439_1
MLLIELIFFFFFLLLFHYFYNIHTMSTLILSITTILLMIIAPAFCGTLYALSDAAEFGNLYYSINPDNADDVQKLNDDVNGFGIALDIQYDCLSTKMYAVSKSWVSGNVYVPKIQEMDPYNGNVVDGTIKTLEVEQDGIEFVGSILYGWSGVSNGLSTINPATGQRNNEISKNVEIGSMSGLAYDICTDTMYGVTDENPSLLVSINLDTGVPFETRDTGKEGFISLAFGDNCVLFGGTRSGEIYTIDTETGKTKSLIATIEGRIDGLTFIATNGCLTKQPTANPTISPTVHTSKPTKNPTKTPTKNPTKNPTKVPTKNPTKTPTKNPTTPTPTKYP